MIEAAREAFAAAWTSNEFLSGGLFLMVIGGAAALLRSVPARLLRLAERRWTTQVEVRHGGGALKTWLAAWTDRHAKLGRRNLMARTRNLDEGPPTIVFEPGFGTHVAWWRKRPIVIRRQLQKPEGEGGALADLLPQEVYEIRTIGSDPRALREFLNEVRRVGLEGERLRPEVYVSGEHGWRRIEDPTLRPLASVVLPGTMGEDVLATCRRFLGAREAYERRGTPWRVGFLLEGPPGSGKTSLAAAIANELRAPLYWLNLANPALSDSGLFEMMADMRRGAVLLIEDVDSVGLERGSSSRREGKRDEQKGVTLSGVLNALDGITAGTGRILLMTTNNPGALDEALVRPGRVDHRLYIGAATREQAERLFLRFFPTERVEARRFAEVLIPGETSMADLQAALLPYADWEPKEGAKTAAVEFQRRCDARRADSDDPKRDPMDAPRPHVARSSESPVRVGGAPRGIDQDPFGRPYQRQVGEP